MGLHEHPRGTRDVVQAHLELRKQGRWRLSDRLIYELNGYQCIRRGTDRAACRWSHV